MMHLFFQIVNKYECFQTDVLRKFANDAHGNSKEIEKHTDEVSRT